MGTRTSQAQKHRLTPQQQKAAEILVENEFAMKGEKRSLEAIAEEVGVTVRALYNWRKDPDFIGYSSSVSTLVFESYTPLAESQLIKGIMGTSNNGIASTKSLEMFFKLTGRFVDQRVVTQIDGSSQSRMSPEELRESLAGMNDLLK